MFFLLRLLLTQETERRVLGTLRLSPGDTAISLGAQAPGPLTSPSHTWGWDRSTRHWGGQFGRVPHRIRTVGTVHLWRACRPLAAQLGGVSPLTVCVTMSTSPGRNAASRGAGRVVAEPGLGPRWTVWREGRRE